MDKWTKDPQTGYHSTAVKKGRYTVIIHRPELDERTRDSRQREVQAALAQFGRELQKIGGTV